ncbi:hypothetical protein U1Q18_035944, partial [Sarracenia purpurea var. burkii]
IVCLFLLGVLVEILVALGIIKSYYFWLEVEQTKEAIQNALVCVEMVFFAVIQQYAYSVGPYGDDEAAKPSVKEKKKD